jgi:predicted transposase YbfD/YdcC
MASTPSRLDEIVASFSALEDPRSPINRRHPLPGVLVIAVLAVLAGAAGPTAIGRWARIKEGLLTGVLGLPRGIPGKDVFRRVLMTLKPEAFEAAFNAWIARLRDDATAETGVQRPIISFDGKAARRSHDARNELGPLHVVTAWAGGYGLALGQQVCEEKSNEITAIPELLRKVDVRDGIVTIDAMGAQKAIAEEVVRGKADYVLALRGNQESMHHAVIAYIDDQLEGELEGAEELTTADRGHGREEERTYLQLPAPGSLPGRGEWKGLKSIGVVTSRRLKGDRERLETRYYLSSLPVDVALFARAVRGHWSVEDACHWTLDVTFREDDSRVRERVLGSNIAWLYRFTLSILKQHPDRRMSLIMKRRACGWSGEFLMEAIAALTCYCAPALTGGNLLHGLHPTQQGLLEGRRVEPGQHAAEGIFGGDAALQVEEAGQPCPGSVPNSWMAAKELAPERTPQTAMKAMLISGCLRVRSTWGRSGPGSGRGRWCVGRWA